MEKIKLVFICDNGFVMQTATAITSAIENKNRNSCYDIYVICSNVSEENKNKLKSLNTKKCKIILKDGDTKKFSNLHQYREGGYLSATEAALLKFDIPQILNELDKVLYMDGDVIIKKDLSTLFNIDLGDMLCAAACDSGAIYFKHQYAVQYPKYFNSGVMLLNLKRMRELNITQTLINTKKEINDKNLMDQNVFNIVFDKQIKILDIKWNFLIVNLERAKGKWSIEQINELFNSNYKNFYDIKKHSAIIHFSSKDKPWKFSDTPYADIWFKYYKKSPFKKENLNRTKLHKKTSLLEHIFSVRNDDRYHKIINLCGIKFKFKNKVKILENEIIYLNKTLKQINHERNFINQRGINKDKIQYEINNFAKSGIDENSDIIISLTSYPKRMYDIHYTIYSLLNQTIKPKKIILWLSQEQFPNRESDLGENILNLRKFGLTIKFIEGDIKSYKKLIPALKEYPENIIITVDDDIYYENDCIEKLYNTYLETGSKYITANRCHLIKLQNNQISRYKNWEKNINREEASYLNFFTGAGAVLYPPNSLHNDILKEELFTTLAPNADDIWFWAMGVLKDTKIKIPQNSYKKLIYTNPIRELGLNDDGTLFTTNKTDNDTQMQNILKIYPQILEKLNEEYSNSLQL